MRALWLIPCWIVAISHAVTEHERYGPCQEIIKLLPDKPTKEDIDESMLTCGLFPYLENFISEFPSFLKPHMGKGVGIWQYPIQFVKYIDFILQFPIQTYVEIGVAAGGTFIYTTEIIRRYNPDARSYGVDIAPIGYASSLEDTENPYEHVLGHYVRQHDYTTFHQGTSETFLSLHPSIAIDVVLIDGDHTVKGVFADVNLLSPYSKIMVFHDIQSDECLGLMQYWENMKLTYPSHTIEFIDQYEELYPQSYLGIGVLVNPFYYDCHYQDNSEEEEQEEGKTNADVQVDGMVVFKYMQEIFICMKKS